MAEIAEFRSSLRGVDRDVALSDIELQPASADAFDDPHELTIVDRPLFASLDVAADESDDGDDLPTIRPASPLDDSD